MVIGRFVLFICKIDKLMVSEMNWFMNAYNCLCMCLNVYKQAGYEMLAPHLCPYIFFLYLIDCISNVLSF